MDNYDFDIKQMLAAFDGDAEKLANAFANELNKELAANRRKEDIAYAAQDVADTWNAFVDTYFDYYTVPKGFTVSDFKLADENDNTAESVLEFLIKAGPLLRKYGSALQALEKVDGKLTATMSGPTAVSPSDGKSFDDTMKKFFEKMGW